MVVIKNVRLLVHNIYKLVVKSEKKEKKRGEGEGDCVSIVLSMISCALMTMGIYRAGL